MIAESILKLVFTANPNLDIRGTDINSVINNSILPETRSASRNFTPSSYTSFCTTKEVFRRLKDDWTQEDDRTSEDHTLALMGTAYHAYFQSRAFNPYMWGDWSCLSCGKKFLECFFPSTRCCKFPEIFYKEKHFKALLSSKLDIFLSGKIDGILVFPEHIKILELKTIDMLLAQGLKKEKNGNIVSGRDILPLASHVTQSKLYPELAAPLLNAYFPDKNVVGTELVYINRNGPPFRGFFLPRNPRMLADAKQKAAAVEHFVELKSVEGAHKICSNRQSTYAKNCPFKDNCFPLKRSKNLKSVS